MLNRVLSQAYQRFVAGGLALVLIAGAAVACGGDDDANPASEEVGPVVTLATFTPVPADFTPEALQTRSAQQTAFAATQTAQPDIEVTAPPEVTFPTTPQATAAANQIKPAEAQLVTSGGQAIGSIGSFNWFDPTSGNGADVQAPYIDLPAEETTWAVDTAAQVVVPNSPYAVMNATVTMYDYGTNIAIPTNEQGQTLGTTPVFYVQEPAVYEDNLQGPALSIAPDVEPGKYVVSVVINWVTPAELQQPLHTHYIFIVTVI